MAVGDRSDVKIDEGSGRAGVASVLYGTQTTPGDTAVTTDPMGRLSVIDVLGSATRGGRGYLAGSSALNVAAAGNIRMALTNPAGSGKKLYIYRLSGLASITVFGHLYINPATGVPTSARPINNTTVGGPASVAQLFADTNLTTGVGGGTDSGIDIGFGAGSRVSVDGTPLLIIPPGVTLGINFPLTSAGTVTANLLWEEA